MIGRPPGFRRLDPFEPELGQIEPIGECVDHANRIVLVDPVLQAFRKQRALPAIRTLNKAPHPIPRKSVLESYPTSHARWRVFTHGVTRGLG